jgi:hypothetical protein
MQQRHNKFPVTTLLPVLKQRVYIGYLFLKSLTPSDRLYKKGLKGNKNKVAYWGKKLVSAGLIEDHGDYYRIKSYQAVWSALGVSKVMRKHGHYGFRHVNLDISEKNFLKDGLVTLHMYLAKKKRRQISAVVATKQGKSLKMVRKTQTCRLSCNSVASLLGYRSGITGAKYRKKYFEVVKPKDTKRVKIPVGADANGFSFMFRVPCFHILLRD